MIEKIKNEIYNIKPAIIPPNEITRYVALYEIIEILDKYKDNDSSNKRLFKMTIEKNSLDNCRHGIETYELSMYKEMWETIKAKVNLNQLDSEIETNKVIYRTMKRLEQKYLGVKK